jgi:hypothetical protein
MSDEQQRVAAAVVMLILLKRRRKITIWVKPWISRRHSHGAYSCLFRELWVENFIQLRNLLRMSSSDIEEIVAWIGPAVSKEDTTMRRAISVHVCL